MMKLIGKCPETRQQVYIVSYVEEWGSNHVSCFIIVREDRRKLYRVYKENRWHWSEFGEPFSSLKIAQTSFWDYFNSIMNKNWLKEGF